MGSAASTANLHEIAVVKAPCGVANLLSSVFGIPLEKSYKAVGLELCFHCGKVSTEEYYPHHRLCLWRAEHAKIPLICDGCGISFTRYKSVVRVWAERGGQRVFCSKSCNGKDQGARYGFGSPPSSKQKGSRRQHIAAIRETANQQASDDALWPQAQTDREVLLQEELRRLHSVINSRPEG